MGLLNAKERDPKEDDRSKGHPAHVVPNAARTHKFLTTRRYPIYYMPITKCGSTYLKNLFYALDHDQAHVRADTIHDHPEDLMRADNVEADRIRNSPFAFTVLRRPVSRVVSVYFDKIYRDGPQNFPQLRMEIAREAGLDLTAGIDLLAHRENLHRFTAWLGRNIAGDTDADMNPHWRPQSLRVNTVRHLGIGFLTLDGLNDQLRHLLGDVVPNLQEKMALAASQNRSAYPFDPAQIMTPTLERAINEIYADDLVHYSHVARYWKANPPRVETEPPALGLNVLSTHTQNLNILVPQKAGCTYLRNLTYQLDHGRVHPDPAEIDNDQCLAYRTKTKRELSKGVNIFVMRDPVARFFSLYFDKVWGDGEQSFPWIAEQLAKNRRFRRNRQLSQAEHHDNCCRLLGFLKTRFSERAPEDLNPHWRPQSVRLERAQSLGFKPVLLEDIERQLKVVCSGSVRGLSDALALTTFTNATEKPIDPALLLSPWIKERLQALYGADIALYERIKAGWAATGTPPEL